MRSDVEAGLVGAASIMDLSGETVMRYSRKIGVADAEAHLALMRTVRLGQTVMCVLTLIVLTVAVTIAINFSVVTGGAVAIAWTVFSFGISVWDLLR